MSFTRLTHHWTTLGTGRTSMMPGAVHRVLFATYLVLACIP
jgi:hypothetical protein